MAFNVPILMSMSHIKSAIKQIASHFVNYPELNENSKIDPSLIDVDPNNRFVTDSNISNWNNKQNNLGFTPENTANKNTSNGYMGLDSNGRFTLEKLSLGLDLFEYNPLINQKTRGTATNDVFIYTVSPNFVFNPNGNLNINYSASKKFSRPIMYIPSGSNLGGIWWRYNTGSTRLSSPVKMLISLTIIPNLNNVINEEHSIYFGISSSSSVQGLTSYDGNGLLFKRLPSENSGKWQIIQVNSNIMTKLLDTNISFADYTKYNLTVFYDTEIETAYFYINYELIHTQINVNLNKNVDYYLYGSVYSAGANFTSTKTYGVLDLLYGLKNVS